MFSFNIRWRRHFLFCLRFLWTQRDQRSTRRFASHREDCLNIFFISQKKEAHEDLHRIEKMKRLEMSRRWGRAKTDMKTLSRSKTDQKVGQRVIWQFICVMYLDIDGITNLNFYFISVSGKEPKTHFCFNNALQFCSPYVTQLCH